MFVIDVGRILWSYCELNAINTFQPILEQRKPDMRQVHAVFTRRNGLYGARKHCESQIYSLFNSVIFQCVENTCHN